ncbi:MAG TPA: carboxypeptidase-like regulatory domain-containing protein, partial [Planctomycetota bacterium]|nr:carboxypeptidase-like regulatory domain-containing protein [Planctomycetota bacterium]
STGVEAPPDATVAARLDPRAPAEVDLGVRTDRRIVVTDADGRYEARGLAAGSAWRARVRPTAEENAVEILEDVRLVDGETREVAHGVRAAGTLVTVLEPGTAFGLRPVGGTLLVHGLAPRDDTTAGEDRVTGLAPGEWELLAFPSRPGVPFAVARFEVVGGGTARVDGPAASDVVMRGRVTQAGLPAEGAWVSALGLGSRPTGADGRYEFEGPVGVPMLADVTFRAPGPDGVELRGQLTCMALGNRVLERDLALPAGSIEAHVLDAEGRPVTGALAHLRPRGEADGWLVLSPVGIERTTDGGGRARWTGVPPGAWTVRVEVPSSGARVETPVDLGDQDRAVALEVREPATGRLKVVVLDDAGRPLPGARVRAIGSTDALYPFSAPTGADGSTVVAGLPAGSVRLVAVLVDAGEETAALASRPADAEVVAGEERSVILTWQRPRAGAGDGGAR